MVGMGSVITKSVPDFHLVLGHPAITVGYVCRCGQRLLSTKQMEGSADISVDCNYCGLKYRIANNIVTELTPPQ